MLLSQASTGVGFLILAVSNSLGLIFLSRLVDGASAGNVSLIYTAVLDRYPREARTRVLGLLSTGSGLGLLAGPLIGGLLGAAGLALPAFVAAGLAGLTIVLTSVLFPAGAPRPGAARPLDLHASFGMLREPAIRRTLRLILLNNVVYNAFVLTLPVFLQQRLGYGEKEVGTLLSGLLLLGAAFQVLILPWLFRVLRNRTAVWLGLALYAAGFAALAFAADLPGVVAAATFVVAGLIILNPVLAAALGNQATGTDDGALMGLNQAVVSTGQITGPLIGYAALYLGAGAGLALVLLLLTATSMVLLRGVTIYG